MVRDIIITVLVIFYLQLDSLCNCSDNVNCGSKEEAESEVLSTALGHGDRSEYCTVRTIRNVLVNFLRFLQKRTQIGLSDKDLQCTLNFEEREQILAVGSQVRSLEHSKESCTLPRGYPNRSCRTQGHFALFQQLPALLRNETDLEREELGDDLEAIIPYINSTLQDHLEVSGSIEEREDLSFSKRAGVRHAKDLNELVAKTPLLAYKCWKLEPLQRNLRP